MKGEVLKSVMEYGFNYISFKLVYLFRPNIKISLHQLGQFGGGEGEKVDHFIDSTEEFIPQEVFLQVKTKPCIDPTEYMVGK